MMYLSGFNDKEIIHYAGLTADYIKAQREAYFPKAAPLAPERFDPFLSFFSEAVLKTTRFHVKQEGPIENPDFLKELHDRGIPFSLDRLKAITFQDVVVSFEELEPRVVFHELVHAVQYQKLGLKQFAYKYFKGFLTWGAYERIPLEANARLLDEAYAKDPGKPFSVEAEVQKWINENRF